MVGLVTDEMTAVVGRPFERRTSHPIDASAIRRWALAVYWPEPAPREFWDTDTPGGLVAPADFNPFAWQCAKEVSLLADGSEVPASERSGPLETRLGITPPPTKTAMNGGLDVEYGVPMRIGDVIVSTGTIGGYSERPGRTGPMLFTIMESRWTNQRDELVKIYRMNLIRR
jgi:hypothetical protein